jgi:hypothetical protein
MLIEWLVELASQSTIQSSYPARGNDKRPAASRWALLFAPCLHAGQETHFPGSVFLAGKNPKAACL